MIGEPKKSTILYLGTYPPRECGIATFTKDLTSAIKSKCSPQLEIKICAMIKSGEETAYSEEVIFKIRDSNIQEYLDAAKEINRMEEIKLVCIQHEFGIFGGEYGCYLLAFLDLLKKPVVVTFHTVLPNPNEALKQTVKDMARKVSSIIVMTPKAVEILTHDYGLDTDFVVIPHGIPSVPFNDCQKKKRELGLSDKLVLTSFGLISSGKGYEQAIEALPEVKRHFPNVLYLILGETHPVVKKNEGERYRKMLQKKVKNLALQDQVQFYNKYLTKGEIINFLSASDIYLSCGKNPHQITSGTLSYALGCGKATISTPFLHALDLISPERGILTEFDNPESFAKAIITILSDRELQESMAKNSYFYTRPMTWPNVAISYLELFRGAIRGFQKYEQTFPEINYSHLCTMTDHFGIIQFADQAIPDASSGYTLDDNARALLACSMAYGLTREKSHLPLIRTYLAFMRYVFEEGLLYNVVDVHKNINRNSWSADAQGRAIWALGYVASLEEIPLEIRSEAEELFSKVISSADKITSPRAVSFIITGWYYYQQYNPKSENLQRIKKLADHLVSLYSCSSSEDWQWFESSLTYSNSKLAEGLFYSYLALGEKKYLQIAQKTLDFLCSITFENGFFQSIGQNGWYVKNGQRSYFDQQPIDTSCMVQTLALAYKITGKKDYFDKMILVFEWFTGTNALCQMVYNDSTGGCHDGLGQFSLNLNQGAESTIAYLMARLTVEKLSLEEKNAASVTLPLPVRNFDLSPSPRFQYEQNF